MPESAVIEGDNLEKSTQTDSDLELKGQECLEREGTAGVEVRSADPGEAGGRRR